MGYFSSTFLQAFADPAVWSPVVTIITGMFALRLERDGIKPHSEFRKDVLQNRQTVIEKTIKSWEHILTTPEPLRGEPPAKQDILAHHIQVTYEMHNEYLLLSDVSAKYSRGHSVIVWTTVGSIMLLLISFIVPGKYSGYSFPVTGLVFIIQCFVLWSMWQCSSLFDKCEERLKRE